MVPVKKLILLSFIKSENSLEKVKLYLVGSVKYVITSYSIHYTKLYEMKALGFMGQDTASVCCADQVRDFPKWRAPEQIVRHVRLAVMDREGESARELVRGVPGGAQAVFVPVRNNFV